MIYIFHTLTYLFFCIAADPQIWADTATYDFFCWQHLFSSYAACIIQ